jgi:osmoprotectant transport system ATP-binding protein
MIRLENVSKTYAAGSPILHSLNLEISRGEFAVLVGPSGCGKSTTLSLINRLNEPSAGIVRIEGQDASGLDPVELRRHIGFVFQDIGLFPHLTAGENIGVTPRLLHWPQDEIENRVRELLELVRLAPHLYIARLPGELSGGEQQRVGMARALAARPKIMLMDEPFGALDPLVRDELASDYRDIHRQFGLTTVLVTHDMTEALLLADTIAVMHKGKIVQSGTPRALIEAPANDFVRRMIETPRRQADRLAEALKAAHPS